MMNAERANRRRPATAGPGLPRERVRQAFGEIGPILVRTAPRTGPAGNAILPGGTGSTGGTLPV